MTEKLQKEPAENTRFQGKSTFRFLKSLSSLMSREEYSYATLNLAKTRCLLEDATQPRYVLLINFNAPVKLQVHLQRWHPLAFAQIHSPSPRIRKEKKNPSLKKPPTFHSFSYGPNDEQPYIPFSPPHTSPLRHFDSITVLNRTIEPYSPVFLPPFQKSMLSQNCFF